jgi:hypothetical protein
MVVATTLEDERELRIPLQGEFVSEDLHSERRLCRRECERVLAGA